MDSDARRPPLSLCVSEERRVKENEEVLKDLIRRRDGRNAWMSNRNSLHVLTIHIKVDKDSIFVIVKDLFNFIECVSYCLSCF